MNETQLSAPPRGQMVKVTITDLSADGSTVGHHDDGKVVFLNAGLPGERVLARVYEQKKKFDRARVVEIVAKSPERISAPCRHFSVCGGCAWQDLDYTAQLRFKQKQAQEALTRIGKYEDFRVDEAIPAPAIFQYRNKMEFSFAKDETAPSDLRLGLHHRGEWSKVFDVEDCLLQSDPANILLRYTRDFARRHNLIPYDLREREGFLRFLVIRTAERTGELLLSLITSDADFPHAEEFVAGALAVAPTLTTITHGVNDSRANIAYAEIRTILHGPGYITDTILGRRFRVYPNSFMQTNSAQTETLYSLALDRAGLRTTDRLLDLYCGAGTISLCAADRVSQVIGIESEPSAILSARENANENCIGNAEFIAGDVRTTLRERKMEFYGVDVIISDPPRAGMHPRGVHHMATLGARRIVYISCNPAAFARDAAILRDLGYTLTQVTPVDMFPHTTHIELVSSFDLATTYSACP